MIGSHFGGSYRAPYVAVRCSYDQYDHCSVARSVWQSACCCLALQLDEGRAFAIFYRAVHCSVEQVAPIAVIVLFSFLLPCLSVSQFACNTDQCGLDSIHSKPQFRSSVELPVLGSLSVIRLVPLFLDVYLPLFIHVQGHGSSHSREWLLGVLALRESPFRCSTAHTPMPQLCAILVQHK